MKKILSTFVALMVCAMMTSIVSAQNPAKEILIKISQSKDCPFSKEVFDAINWDNPNKHNTDEHFQFDGKGSLTQMTSYSLDCFKRKDGNYTALLAKMTVGLNLETETMELKSEMTNWLYKGGKVQLRSIDEILKMPTIADFYSNTADFPKPLYDTLTNAISRYKMLGVEVKSGERKFTVAFMPTNKAKTEGVLEGFDHVKELPQIYYSWDGEKMVRCPESKPYDLDLNLFGVEGYVVKNPENIVKEVWRRYLETDPFQQELSPEECVAEYLDVLTIQSPTVGTVELQNNGTMSFACYPYNKGGWYVLQHAHSSEYNEITTFTFKDGKLEPAPDAFPPFKKEAFENIEENWAALNQLYFIKDYTADSFTVQDINFEATDEDTMTTTIIFKWDGEKFVKQQ